MSFITNVLNSLKTSEPDYEEINTGIDDVVKQLTIDIFHKNHESIDEQFKYAQRNIQEKYYEFNIDEDILLKRAYYIGVMQSISTIAYVFNENLKKYLVLDQLIETTTGLKSLLPSFNASMSAKQFKDLGIQWETIKIGMDNGLISEIGFAGCKRYILTSDGREAKFISQGDVKMLGSNSTALTMHVLDYITDAIENKIDSRKTISDICKDETVVRYISDEGSSFRLINKIKRIINKFQGIDTYTTYNLEDSFKSKYKKNDLYNVRQIKGEYVLAGVDYDE